MDQSDHSHRFMVMLKSSLQLQALLSKHPQADFLQLWLQKGSSLGTSLWFSQSQ